MHKMCRTANAVQTDGVHRFQSGCLTQERPGILTKPRQAVLRRGKGHQNGRFGVLLDGRKGRYQRVEFRLRLKQKMGGAERQKDLCHCQIIVRRAVCNRADVGENQSIRALDGVTGVGIPGGQKLFPVVAAVGRQHLRMTGEGICFDGMRTGCDVFAVNLNHCVRVGQIGQLTGGIRLRQSGIIGSEGAVK